MTSWAVKYLGQQHYHDTWQAMRDFTDTRTADTPDQCWLLQHYPVFTLGQAGKISHLLHPDPQIPVINSDRGGQITYHGPGQLVVYFLIDLRRKKFNIRELVNALEYAVIGLLADYQITGHTKVKAPGVYVDNSKICSIGLRVRKGCTYHGLALNVDMDTTPFSRINPCGFSNLTITQLKDLQAPTDLNKIQADLLKQLMHFLQYTANTVETALD